MQAEQIVNDRITRSLEALFPLGEGRVTSREVERELRHVATVALREGASETLLTLLTVEDVAEKLNVTPRRVRAIARARNALPRPDMRIGWQVPGSNVWLFRPQEVEMLRPGPVGRPRKSSVE